ncbi:Vld1p KNAG_0D04580 [Huiozyma naganishii CBS 8797]|uniref:Uncharacterized protein n=1 Tax=Huiozyma naganishii (strain ATCC MYA-139 / BCRC 22969 / CBS 8797 / KCTC 17520 / NBRC 10181 / NCYC 3082 / Yp74L-3) TaxID=1071383 RepID=J7RL24_HUIN7|nr:hypothetical protein KNAG_0D04580 [Kazachstania naganishii CBS 8797]CCK70203.1 hypothetical protein KNAG_0D04580 [Kazachstania naganishii CBS 8797]
MALIRVIKWDTSVTRAQEHLVGNAQTLCHLLLFLRFIYDDSVLLYVLGLLLLQVGHFVDSIVKNQTVVTPAASTETGDSNNNSSSVAAGIVLKLLKVFQLGVVLQAGFSLWIHTHVPIPAADGDPRGSGSLHHTLFTFLIDEFSSRGTLWFKMHVLVLVFDLFVLLLQLLLLSLAFKNAMHSSSGDTVGLFPQPWCSQMHHEYGVLGLLRQNLYCCTAPEGVPNATAETYNYNYGTVHG